MSASLEPRVALITGAGSGIGAAIHDRLLSQGFTLVALDRDAKALSRYASGTAEGCTLTLAGDAADLDVLARAVHMAVERFGRLDAAVFNAGIAGTSAPLEDYPIEVFDEVMRVNVHGPWHGIQAVAPVMKSARSGSIVLISSINGIRGFPTFSAYAASKQAVMGMARTAAIDLARHGIRVNSVHPGLVDTPMMQFVEDQVGGSDQGTAREGFNGFVPLHRYAQPAEIAHVVAFLAGAEASYVTGAGYIVDGGFTSGIPG